jgi:KEOPS complex subunit Pcc1
MRAEFEFEIENAELIYKALKVEETKTKAKVYLEKGKLMLTLEAEDLTSLRAAVNAWLRFVKVCKDVIKAVEGC